MRLPVAAHAVIDPVQPVLRGVSYLQDMVGLALALAAAIALNHRLGRPSRSLVCYTA